jgi:hypothetical protein
MRNHKLSQKKLSAKTAALYCDFKSAVITIEQVLIFPSFLSLDLMLYVLPIIMILPEGKER